MKVLRFLLILIVILFAGYLILCATSPATMEIERSTIINAPKGTVWNQMVNLKNWQNWSPWKEMDTTIVSTVTGNDGQIGAKSSWVSDNSGTGNMTIVSIEGYNMGYDMELHGMMEGEAKGHVVVEDAEGGTKATQIYSSPTSFMMRGMSTLMFKSFMESQFDRGLELLKMYVESGKAETPGYEITDVTFPATSFATIRKVMPLGETSAFFHQAYGEIGAAAGDKVVGPNHTITYKWDMENGQADLAAAIPVSGDVTGMAMMNVPESKGHMLKMVGAYTQENFMNAHMAISAHTTEHGLTDPLVIEEYVVTPKQESDSNKYVTNIYYLNK